MCLLGRSTAIIWGWAGYAHLSIAGSACNMLVMWHNKNTWFNRPLDISHCCPNNKSVSPDSKVHGASMGPTWGRQDPGGPHVGHTNLAIWVVMCVCCPNLTRPVSLPYHYNDVIMSMMASQFCSLTIVYSNVYWRRSKKTSKLRVTGLCEGNSPVTGEFTGDWWIPRTKDQ